jgi:diamine N-acetyltransferase
MEATPDVSLREITQETVWAIIELSVSEAQQDNLATNAESLAEALFTKEAWYRAIYAGEIPVGFTMLYDETLRAEPPFNPRIELWRLMVDARYQRKGYGTAALQLLLRHARNMGYREIFTSYLPGTASPETLYLKAGFVHTGKVEDREIVLRCSL